MRWLPTFPFANVPGLFSALKLINLKLETIIMEQAAAVELANAIKDQITKSRAEFIARIDALEAVIRAQGAVSPELEAALLAAKGESQISDDVNPDAPPV